MRMYRRPSSGVPSSRARRLLLLVADFQGRSREQFHVFHRPRSPRSSCLFRMFVRRCGAITLLAHWFSQSVQKPVYCSCSCVYGAVCGAVTTFGTQFSQDSSIYLSPIRTNG